jgi:hypothetical protein
MPPSVARDTLGCGILGIVTSVEEMAQHQHTHGADGGANAKQYPLPERPQAFLGPDACHGPGRRCHVLNTDDHIAERRVFLQDSSNRSRGVSLLSWRCPTLQRDG